MRGGRTIESLDEELADQYRPLQRQRTHSMAVAQPKELGGDTEHIKGHELIDVSEG
jgi:hypothetical protein